MMANSIKDIDFDMEIELLENKHKLPDNVFIDENGVSALVEGLTNDIYTIALKILDVAQSKVPVDTGFLKSRGRVEKTQSGCSIVYDTDYAIYVHEDTGVRHKIGTSKFLSEAYEEVMAENNIGLGGGIGD